MDQFVRVATLIEGVKRGRESGADEEITMITGATISSQAVIDVINLRVDELRSPIETYWASGAPAVDVPPRDTVPTPVEGSEPGAEEAPGEREGSVSGTGGGGAS